MSVRPFLRQLGGDTLIYGIGGTINRFIALFLIPIYTRVFSTDEYGVIATFTAFISGAFLVVVFGLDSASSRWFYERQDPAYKKSVISSWFWFQSGWGMAIATSIVLFARPITRLLAISDKYSYLAVYVAAMILLTCFSKVTVYTLRLQRRPWTMVIYAILSTLLIVGGILLFVVTLKKGLRGFYIAQVAMGIIMGIAGLVLLREWISPRDFKWSRLTEMLRFGLPIVPFGICQWITLSSDRILLGYLANTSEVGVYAIAYSLTAPIGLLTMAFSMAYGPFSMSLIQHPSSRLVYSKVLSLYAAIGCFICTFVSLFAPELVALVTTPKFHAAANCLPFLSFAVMLSGGAFVAMTGLSIAKRTNLIALGAFIGAALDVGLNFLLIPIWKKQGAAISVLVSSLVSLIVVFYFSQKHFHIPYQFGVALELLGLSALLIGINAMLPGAGHFSLPLAALKLALCATFLPVAFHLGVLKRDYFKPFLQFFARLRP
jgi:O-antigen/teichoic acid export membrane protein